MPKLTIEILKREAQVFSRSEAEHKEKSLFGITDGKAVGTYLEHKFKAHLRSKYTFEEGSSASGIDFPGLQVDMRCTNIYQPYSSYLFNSVLIKIYGLEHSVLWFLYEKADNIKSRNATLNILYAFFLNSDRTADFRTTHALVNILKNDGNKDDVFAFICDGHLATDEIEASQLADKILSKPPKLGYLGSSNTSHWQMQLTRAIERAPQEEGVALIYRAG